MFKKNRQKNDFQDKFTSSKGRNEATLLGCALLSPTSVTQAKIDMLKVSTIQKVQSMKHQLF